MWRDATFVESPRPVTDTAAAPRTLAELGLTGEVRCTAPGWEEIALTGLSVDSRMVRPGHLFAALPGSNAHGARFAQQAVAAGAAVILTDVEGAALVESAPVLVSDDPRAALAHAAARWYGAQPETMVAVTGTNGKTSVATFTRQIWQAMGLPAVNFGTTGVEGHIAAPLSHTTPEPITLHHLLCALHEQGVTHGAMEASSHGLAQRRLDGVRLAAAGFTHLSRDHLDYHATFQDYEAAKALLFGRVLPEGATAVINTDTEAGQRMAAVATARGQRVIALGQGEEARIRLIGVEFRASGQRLTYRYGQVEAQVELPLIGAFQAENALLAAGLAIGAGGAPARVFSALSQLEPVAGRMQRVAHRQTGGTVYVDYSHTPDSVATALKALRPHVEGRLIVAVGAGGDRDPGKRPMMGRAAVENADIAIITDDNPRSEDPATIRAAVLEGAPGAREIGDREQAIRAGCTLLRDGDVFLIAGKGHETGQIVGDVTLPFDDAEVAARIVAELDGLP